MAKSNNQKLKILYIMQLLMDNTDEEHAMSASDIIDALEERGICAERKSIYDDIEMLKLFGIDILSRRSEPKGYYIASRDFELPELKLLVDAVQSSKFITEKKSRGLIKKIEGLAGRHQAKELQSQVVVSNRIKTMNESIYYNVDKIHSAISSNSKIRCKYCEWTTEKKLEPKKNGSYYLLSPWILTWDDENYYMIAYDEASGQMRHYRVDKMMSIELTGEAREGREEYNKIDVADFSKKTFGMFAGSEREIELKLNNSLIGVVMDRFGKEVRIRKNDNISFTATVRVNVSAQFYGWLAALGSGAEIVSPREEAEKYAAYIADISAKYAYLK
jgi:predicted DNA-binding transcriptional regulator YafY